MLAHRWLTAACLSRQTRSANWDASLTIFAEALLKDLIGFHLSTKWLQKSKDFFVLFLCWRRFCSETELLSAGKMDLFGFQVLVALRFYETVKMGTAGAVGEHVIKL